MLFGRGEPEVGGGARGALGGWQMGALGRGTGVLQVKARWRRARPWPVIPTPECHPRGESEREVGVNGRTSGRRDKGGVHSWGGAKADGGVSLKFSLC